MLATSTAAAIRRDISAGVFRPGQQLHEAQMSAEYQVSRNTLREAFMLLSAEQVVERIPNRGVFIATPTAESVIDLYRARIALETAGVKWGQYLDAEAVLRITSRAQSAVDNDAKNLFEIITEANQRFHRELVAASGSATLLQEMDNLLARMRLTFLFVLPDYPSVHLDRVAPNACIAQLLAEGARDEAVELLHEQLSLTCNLILDALPNIEN